MLKNKKNKHLLLSAFFIVFIFWGTNSALALEVNLGLGNNPTLPQYVTFIFSWLIGIAGALALISFTIGAIGLINPNVEAHSDAKDRMKGAVLGLVLTLASFIILNTINPALTTPTLTPLPPIVVPTPPPQPGVYFYLSPDCSGDNSGANTASQNEIGSPFKRHIGSIKIINDPTNDLYYGVIFHKETGLNNGGECSLPITDAGCRTGNIDASAADIFRSNKNPGASGDGVTFYSEPFGWATGAKAGFESVEDQYILFPYLIMDPSKMLFSYKNIFVPPGYENQYKTFRDRPGSIGIKGNYLIALYSKDIKNRNYCQTFAPDPTMYGVPNLQSQPIIASGALKLDRVYIIPTK